MDFPVVPLPIINDALLLGTMIFKFSESVALLLERESQDKAREYDTLGTCLRTLIGVRIGKKLVQNTDIPAARFWSGRLPCDCYPISAA